MVTDKNILPIKKINENSAVISHIVPATHIHNNYRRIKKTVSTQNSVPSTPEQTCLTKGRGSKYTLIIMSL